MSDGTSVTVEHPTNREFDRKCTEIDGGYMATCFRFSCILVVGGLIVFFALNGFKVDHGNTYSPTGGGGTPLPPSSTIGTGPVATSTIPAVKVGSPDPPSPPAATAAAPVVVDNTPLAALTRPRTVFEFRQTLFDEFRAAITKQNDIKGNISIEKLREIDEKYMKGVKWDAFLDEYGKYRRSPADTAAMDSELVMFAGGDWGHKLNRKGKGRSAEIVENFQRLYLNEIPDVARKFAVAVLLGDNWYPAGLKHASDGRTVEFDVKFLIQPIFRVPYYATLGNHDSYGNGQAQVDYSMKQPFWNCPGFQFISPIIRRGKVTVQIFALNTRLHFEQNFPLIPAQAPWLDSALANSTAMWKVVITHEPLFSFNDFEHERALLQHIHPILMKHKVPLYMAGHAHSLSLFQCPGGYFQLTSGGMNGVLQGGAAKKRPIGGFFRESGAATIKFTESEATVIVSNYKGEPLYTQKIPQDPVKRLELFKSTDPWLWKHKTACAAHADDDEHRKGC